MLLLSSHQYILSLKQTGWHSPSHSSFHPETPRTWWKEGPARKTIGCDPCFVEGKTAVLADTLCSRRALLHHPARKTHGWLHQVCFLLNHCSSFIKAFCLIMFTCLNCIFKVNSTFERKDLNGPKEISSGYTAFLSPRVGSDVVRQCWKLLLSEICTLPPAQCPAWRSGRYRSLHFICQKRKPKRG